MKEQEVKWLLAERQDAEAPAQAAGEAGLLLSDPAHRRLLESLSVQLELHPVHLDLSHLRDEQLLRCELIVADADLAPRIRERLHLLGEQSTH